MSTEPLASAALFLQDGSVFSGFSPSWIQDMWNGEVVFTTGMTGYVESLTDPSFAGQILVFSYPLIGNYGVSAATTWESDKIQVKGVIVSSLMDHPSHHLSTLSLKEWLKLHKVPYLTGVDTRALVRHLRTAKTTLGCVTKHTSAIFEPFEEKIVSKVTLQTPLFYGTTGKKIILVDCGMKENILRTLLQFPLQIKRVPYTYDYSHEEFDGIFLSNGPGDPAVCVETIAILQKALEKKKPTFGICLGAQLLALSCGAKTFKLPFGHRGHNQPCLEKKTGKAFLTSQNHGYAIDEKTLPEEWHTTFVNLNDGSVEGIAHKTLPFSAVQFHPEAAPGPTDTLFLFQNFYNELITHA